MHNSNNVELHGFGISHFRSFGSDVQFIGPLKKITIIIGENNSGKSNMTRYISRSLAPYFALKSMPNFQEVDRPQLVTNFPPKEIWLLLDIERQIIRHHVVNNYINEVFQEELIWLATFCKIPPPIGYFWLPILISSSQLTAEDYFNIDTIRSVPRDIARLNRLWNEIFKTSGGEPKQWLDEILRFLTNTCRPKFSTDFISANRRIESCLDEYAIEFGTQTGEAKRLISDLAFLDRPIYKNREVNIKKWDTIQNFVRQVLKAPNINIEIPASQDTINFEWDGRYLPIETLGTGVYQAVLLAAKATLVENRVICIEEPELHFHPEVQRQIISYLFEHTNNQYFITTHSAHILDTVDCTLLSIRHENGNSKIDEPLSANHRREICHQLGYKPSDLLQSNCLIWIEGPSDRIYLNHWIASLDSNLREGWHYSFSFYGGRVLSNFSADEESSEAMKFLQLLPINRFPFVIMDSDVKEVGKSVNATKTRIVDEVTAAGGMSWITRGREIENYATREIRERAMRKVHPNFKCLKTKDADENELSHPLEFINSNDEIATHFDKPAIAATIANEVANLDVLDLRERVVELVNFIKKANQQPPLTSQPSAP